MLGPMHLFSVEEEAENPNSSSKKQTVIWKGEVTAVLKNRGSIKVKIHKNQKILQSNRSEIKSLFSQNMELPVFQKETKIQIGKFILREALWEETELTSRKKYFEVTLRGDFQKDENPRNPAIEITTDSYIASLGEKDFFVEPNSFFKGRATLAKQSIIHPKDRKEMVLVNRGLILYGQGTDASADSFNPNYMNLKLSTIPEIRAFYIDKYEVTNQEYSLFLEKTNRKPPPHWLNGKFPEGEEDHPVHSLTYREAEAYAVWTGKRLPTEWEWERAAKGPGVIQFTNRDETIGFDTIPQRYPFGDEFDPMYCNTRESKIAKTISVYELSEEGASPFGVIGMCGNVPEWTSSWYETYPGHFLRSYALGKQFKVVRGGSFSESARQATVYYRSYGGIPNLTEDRRAGFRLVWDYKE